MKRILISGYHGFGNCGDEAILAAMASNLKQENPDLEIIALSRTPAETRRLYGIKSLNRINIFSIIYRLLQSDLVLSGGGSLLQDVTSSRSLYYYLGIIVLARMLGRPVMVYANGIGPIRNKFNRFLTRMILNRIDMITLRDEDSRRQLMEMGVTRPAIAVTADPVFTLEAVSPQQVDAILSRENISLQRPLIGISVRPWKTGTNYLETIAEIADRIIQDYACNILFIPMQMPGDLGAIRQVQARMKNHSFSIQQQYSAQEMMGIIGATRVIISMRLHTLIFAGVQRVPMIGLVYDPKIQSFLDTVEQPSAGSIDSLDSEGFFTILQEVLDQGETMLQNLEKHANSLGEKAKINDRLVMSLLRKISHK